MAYEDMWSYFLFYSKLRIIWHVRGWTGVGWSDILQYSGASLKDGGYMLRNVSLGVVM
jgi:hypothetical protein